MSNKATIDKIAGQDKAIIETLFTRDAAKMQPNSTAETERKWRIEATHNNGRVEKFSVLAFDYAAARQKAAKKTSGKLTTIALME
jgi:hypothetical protein